MSEISVKSEGIGIPKNQVETLKAIEPVMFDTHFIPFLIYEKNDIYHHYIIIYISVSPWLLNYLMWLTQFMCLYDLYDFGQLYFHSHTQDNQFCSSAALWVSDPWGDTSGLGNTGAWVGFTAPWSGYCKTRLLKRFYRVRRLRQGRRQTLFPSTSCKSL